MIRRRGYYLFHHAILCGFYLRAVFIKVNGIGKSLVDVRALRKASFIRSTKNLDAVAWF